MKAQACGGGLDVFPAVQCGEAECAEGAWCVATEEVAFDVGGAGGVAGQVLRCCWYGGIVADQHDALWCAWYGLDQGDVISGAAVVQGWCVNDFGCEGPIGQDGV